MPRVLEVLIDNRTYPLIVARLVFINQASASQDRAYDDFNTVLLTEIHVNFAIIISCAPFLKQVMQSLQVGWLTNEIRPPRPYASSTPVDLKYQGSSRNRKPALNSGTDSLGWTELRDNVQQDTVITSGCTEDAGVQGEALGEGMVIKQTTMISVQYQG